MNINKHLEVRTKLDKTQSDMAALMGVCKSTWQKWEAGTHPMPAAHAAAWGVIVDMIPHVETPVYDAALLDVFEARAKVEAAARGIPWSATRDDLHRVLKRVEMWREQAEAEIRAILTEEKALISDDSMEMMMDEDFDLAG